MSSRRARLLIAFLLATGLFAQVGLFRTPRRVVATACSCPGPIPGDAEPVDDSSPQGEDERGEESTQDEPGLIVPASSFFRRLGSGHPSLGAGPMSRTACTSRRGPAAGHFLAAGRELRHWIRSQLC